MNFNGKNFPRVGQPSLQPASPTPTQGSLNSNSTFARFNERKQGWPGAGQQPTPPYQTQAMARPRYLTLAFQDMETIKTLPPTFAEAEALAREWINPPPGASFGLRVPVEFASVQASRLLQGPYLWINGEDTYQLAQTMYGLRMEIVTNAPPPPEEEETPPPPPPPPVLEMPATFNLELQPGRTVALDTICASDDDLDMSRTEDGTLVDGNFWGVLKIVHEGDTHQVDFSGTRLTADMPKDYFLDQRTISKLLIATKPTTARCNLTIRCPAMQYVDLNISLASLWNWGVTYPQAEPVSDGKVKYFLRVHPDGYLEHFESNLVTTSIYYEAMPDMSQMDPASYISPANGFAMPLAKFIPHLSKVLDELHLGIPVRTQLLSNAIGSFGNHKNVAYRFMPPERLDAAIKLAVTTEPVTYTRIFLMWRGVTDDELPVFSTSGEKEAAEKDWKGMLGIEDEVPDTTGFRVLETSIMECA